MSTQMPKPWQSATAALPILRDIVSWTPIREWSLSSVHRVGLRSGQTAIAKRSSGPMKGELAIYQSVLIPLGIEHPQIYAGTQTATDCFMVMDLRDEVIGLHRSTQIAALVGHYSSIN